MSRPAWFIVLAAAGYFGLCYYPVGAKYFRVRYAAQELAQDAVDPANRSWSQLRTFVDQVERDTGLRLNTGDVSLRGSDGASEVEVQVDIPVVFRGLDRTHWHRFVIRTSAKRPGHLRGLQ